MFVKTNTPYKIKVSLIDENNNAIDDANVVISIKRKLDNMFFNGITWSEDECDIVIPHLSNGDYEYVYTPDKEGVYIISKRATNNYTYAESEVIQVFDEIDCNDSIVKITNYNFLANDNSDTTIVDSNGIPMQGVKISCINPETKETEYVAQSDKDGCWEMIIKKGTYFFIFEMDGYVTVSFERTVN